MQLQIFVSAQSSKPQTKRSTVLQKVARKLLAPIRNIPLPSSPTHSRSPSASSASSSLRTPQTPTMVVQMTPSASRSQSPIFPLKTKHHKNQHRISTPAHTCNGGGVFVFPTPASAAASVTSSSIHKRRGAIVELPTEWYSKEEYNALGIARTRSNTSVEAERLRRARSYEAPPLLAAETIYSGGFSVLGGMKRGRSAQAALGTATLAPASAPALAEDCGREWEQDAFDWRNSIGLSDEVSISFDFGDELDSVSGEV
jgi:hypothetical protein